MTDIAKVLMQLGRLDAEVDRLVSDKKQLEKENAAHNKAYESLYRDFKSQQETIKSLAEALSEAVDHLAFIANHADLHNFYELTVVMIEKHRALANKHLTEGIGDE